MPIDQPAAVFPRTKLNADGRKKKSPVRFSHGNHGHYLGCTLCHHTQPGFTFGSPVDSCFDCHGPETKGEQLNSYDMIHGKGGLCIGCHKNDENAKSAKAPTACKGCHGGE